MNHVLCRRNVVPSASQLQRVALITSNTSVLSRAEGATGDGGVGGGGASWRPTAATPLMPAIAQSVAPQASERFTYYVLETDDDGGSGGGGGDDDGDSAATSLFSTLQCRARRKESCPRGRPAIPRRVLR